MPLLTLRWTRRADGAVVLTATRPDGTSTWQRHTGPQAGFFPEHDLTHLAVETTLGHRRGFYGLVAEGWALDDFGAPWPRGPLPPEATAAELIVGFLDLERASRAESTAAELNAHAATWYAGHGADASGWRPVDDAALARVRAARDALVARWRAVPPGGTLELAFPFDG